MDFRMFFFCGLHTIVLEIDFKQNKSIMENFDILWWQKIMLAQRTTQVNLRSPGRFIGRLGRLGDLLFYTLLILKVKVDSPKKQYYY